MKKFFRFFLIAIIFILYFLIVTPGTTMEEFFVPQWANNFYKYERENNSFDNLTDVYSFRLGSFYGYISRDGRLKYISTISERENVAISDSAFIHYSATDENLILRDSNSDVITNLDIKGYPLINKNRIFIFPTHREGVFEWDDTGTPLWEKDFGSIITAIDINPGYFLAGMLNGSVELVDRSGSTIFSLFENIDKNEIIYGCSISSDGKFIALTGGISPRMLYIYQKSENEYVLKKSFLLETDFRRRILMKFSPDNSYLFTEGVNNLIYIDINREKMGFCRMEGRLENIVFNKKYGYTIAVSKKENSCQLKIMKSPESCFSDIFFPGNDLMIRMTEDLLFIGIDNRILCISIQEA